MTEENKNIDIAELASQPKKVEIDGRTVEQHSLREMIELDRYLASKKAASRRNSGINFSRFSAGGAV